MVDDIKIAIQFGDPVSRYFTHSWNGLPLLPLIINVSKTAAIPPARRMIGTFFKLVGKALRMAVNRPIQRFNIFNRAKKYLGPDAEYFMPAPRAIGALSQAKPSQYPHLEGKSSFKSIKQKRLNAIAERNQKLLTNEANNNQNLSESNENLVQETTKSFSETKNDDKLVINVSNKLPVIKTVTRLETSSTPPEQLAEQDKPHRPLPKSTNLQLSDPAVIWCVDKVPPGRLDLSKFQELMINRLADENYWTPKQIAETYNIKEEYAEGLIKYYKQIRIIISPRIAQNLDYVARNDPAYQATKHIIYHVDKSLRSDFDKQCDATFLPTDKLDPEIRALLDAGAVQPRRQQAIARPVPLRIRSINDGTTSDRCE
jgi:Fe-S cluster biosynthesis and repair protein YggX